MIRGLLPRLNSTAQALWRFLCGTQIGRLTIMAIKLWPSVRMLSVVVAGLTVGCVVLAGWSGRMVFTALSPASPTGIGAGLAAGLVGLVVLELCAFTVIAGIEAGLQLAHDTGRHRIGVLLALATLLASLAAIGALPEATSLEAGGLAAFGLAGLLLLLTGWFQRRYRRPARRDFRDFHVDVVVARQFLTRALHG
jgi:hypothetical protein